MKKTLYISFCFFSSSKTESSTMENGDTKSISQENTQDAWWIKTLHFVADVVITLLVIYILVIICIIMGAKFGG